MAFDAILLECLGTAPGPRFLCGLPQGDHSVVLVRKPGGNGTVWGREISPSGMSWRLECSDLFLFGSDSANVLIAFDGPDRASVISSLYAWHNLDGYPNGEVWGQYHDVVVRTPSGWLIQSRTIKHAGARDFPADPEGHYMVDWKED